MDLLPIHRMALEERSGFWLMFHEILITSKSGYRQVLLRIFRNKKSAEEAAIIWKVIRHIDSETIIRDDSEKNEMLRKA